MVKTTPVQNKALVLEAFDTLFNKRDYKAAERYWSANYLQHSAHIKPGRDGLFDLIRSSPATLSAWPTACSPNTGTFCAKRFTDVRDQISRLRSLRKSPKRYRPVVT